jgi:hypothetical protein
MNKEVFQLNEAKFFLWLALGVAAGLCFGEPGFGISAMSKLFGFLLLGALMDALPGIVHLFRTGDDQDAYKREVNRQNALYFRRGALGFLFWTMARDVRLVCGLLLFVGVVLSWAIVVAAGCLMIRSVLVSYSALSDKGGFSGYFEEHTNEAIFFWFTGRLAARLFRAFCFGFSPYG